MLGAAVAWVALNNNSVIDAFVRSLSTLPIEFLRSIPIVWIGVIYFGAPDVIMYLYFDRNVYPGAITREEIRVAKQALREQRARAKQDVH